MSESTVQQHHHNEDNASHDEGTEVILPTGWTYGYDESYAQYYYVHSDSGHSQWEYPTHVDDFYYTNSPTHGHGETSPAEGEYKKEVGEEKTAKSFVGSDYKYDWGSKDEVKGESKADYAASLHAAHADFKVDGPRTTGIHRLNPISASHYSMQGYEEEHVDTTHTSTATAAVQRAIPRSPSSSSISKSISLSEYGYHGPTDGLDPEILAAYASSKQSPLMRAAQRRGYNVGSSFRMEPFSPSRHHTSSKLQWESTSPSFEDHPYSPAESYSYGLPSRASGDYHHPHHQEAVEVEWYGSDDDDDHGGGEEDPTVPTEAMKDHPREPSTEDATHEDTIEHATATSSSSKKPKVSMLRGGTNQDYENMARLYRLQRPYADPHYDAACVLCYQNFAEDVFFPCEHHCVCRKCIYAEKICEERMLHKFPDGYINCSLCAAIIKRIVPLNGGREVDEYWAWVLEERPELPREFLRNFKHSAGVIEAVYVSDAFKRAHGLPVDGDGKSCHVS
eukprot:gene2345-1710_t